MADSATALAAEYPAFTTKAELISFIQNEANNSPNLDAILYRLIHTDLNGTGSMTGGGTVTPSSYGL